MGFVHPVHEGLLNELGLDYTERKNIRVSAEYRTSKDKVFACGDSVLGATLVVRAIHSGREAAKNIHNFLINSAK